MINNNEVIETAEEVIETGMSRGLKTAIGVGIAGCVVFTGYKLARLAVGGIKTHMAKKADVQNVDDADSEEEEFVMETEVIEEDNE